MSERGNYAQTLTASPGAEMDFGGLSPGIYELRDLQDGNTVRRIEVRAGGQTVDLSTAETLVRVKLTFVGAERRQAGQVVFTDTKTNVQTPVVTGGQLVLYSHSAHGDANDEPTDAAVFLAPGRYRVSLGGSASYLIGVRVGSEPEAGSTVTVTRQTQEITLHVGQGRGEVDGVVEMADQVVQGAMVLLVPVTLGSPENTVEVERDQTNTDGSFHLRGVIPGRYILTAIDKGWSVNWRDPSTLAGYLVHGTPVEVHAGDKLQQAVTAQKP